MSKRSLECHSTTSTPTVTDEVHNKKCMTMKTQPIIIKIDHKNDEDFNRNQQLLKNKRLDDNTTDIRFVVDNIDIPAHREVIEILKDKRQLVREAIERERRHAQQENVEEASVFQMTGTTVDAFKKLLEYIYYGRVECELSVAIELASTALKLKFHPLVATLAQNLAIHKRSCLSIHSVDELYHIAKSSLNKDLMNGCVKFMDEKARDINDVYRLRDIMPRDPTNVLIYKLDKLRYNNYLHFLLPEECEVCFEVSLSTNRKDWIVVLKNNEIWTKFWNWVYFEEKRIKYVKIMITDSRSSFNIRDLVFDDNFLIKRANVELEFDRQTGYLIPKHDVSKYPIRNTKQFLDFQNGIFTFCNSIASLKDKETNYYYHNIGDGNFLEFYLSQTCLIDRFRVRLWDLDSRTYDFKVQVKNEDEDEYIDIKDNNDSLFRKKNSWVTVDLRGRRPVRWIRITGLKVTVSSKDTEFAIIDFECPSTQRVL